MQDSLASWFCYDLLALGEKSAEVTVGCQGFGEFVARKGSRS